MIHQEENRHQGITTGMARKLVIHNRIRDKLVPRHQSA